MLTPIAPQLPTPRELARRLNVPLHRIKYLLRTRSHIKPAALAGRTRLYRLDVIAELKRELDSMARGNDGGTP